MLRSPRTKHRKFFSRSILHRMPAGSPDISRVEYRLLLRTLKPGAETRAIAALGIGDFGGVFAHGGFPLASPASAVVLSRFL